MSWWSSWADFFAMGGYALYVWGSVLVCAIFLTGEVLLVKMRTATIESQLRQAGRLADKASRRAGKAANITRPTEKNAERSSENTTATGSHRRGI